MTCVYVWLYRRCSTLIAMGPVPHRATIAISDFVNFGKGDDLKQIVKQPPRIEYAVRRINRIY